MKKINVFLLLTVLILAALFSVSEACAAQTYIVLSDIVFVRSDPNKTHAVEDMEIKQLQHEFYNSDFPPYFFYGQNVRGDVEAGTPDAVRIYGMFDQKAITGYIDKKKLWLEPSLSRVVSSSSLILKDSSVRLLPDPASRAVLDLYQGEVVETVGRLQYGGRWWIKAKFFNRYGYLEETDIQPMLQDKIKESSLMFEEIPVKGRDLRLHLSQKERADLSKAGFFIEPVEPPYELTVDDMADLYQRIPSAVFLTSDLFLHSFHLIFDRMLQNIEYEKIYPEIQFLTIKLAEEAAKDLKSYKGKQEKVEKALTYNLFYFSVAAKLLDPMYPVQSAIRNDVDEVVQRIQDASGRMPNLKIGIKPGEEDFSMYRVRGHYETRPMKSDGGHDVKPDDPERLARYFRVMMWYGRRSFPLDDDISTLSAILIVKEVERTGEMKRWKRIDSVLRKLVGKTDDWSPADYRKVIEQIPGFRGATIDGIFNDPAMLNKFKDVAGKTLPRPRIVDGPTGDISQQARISSTAGFRFLGMRFTWDAHMFSQLTHPNVPERNIPTSIDAMAIFGSSAADDLLKITLENQVWKSVYTTQQKQMKATASREIEKRETTYDSWLYTFSSLFLPVESKQFFAQSKDWQYKSLNSALGSWTELKHDTILYSKQSGAEAGEGGEFEIPPYTPPSVKGYVEPNPIFFKRLSELSNGLNTDLQRIEFITDEYRDKLLTFTSMAQNAFAVAKKEVDGVPISEADYRWIQAVRHEFNRGLLLPRDTGDIIDIDLLKMALVADVATDYKSGSVLEVGVGAPQTIIVVVKDFSGGTRVTVGYVYSWYEFTDTKRWKDSEWKAVVYNNDQKQIRDMRPKWYSVFKKPE